MQVLGTVLMREEDELLRADSLGVDVGDELEPVVLEIGEAEVGDLDRAPLGLGEDDPRVGECGGGTRLRVLELGAGQHARSI